MKKAGEAKRMFSLNKPKNEARVVPSAIVNAATREAGRPLSKWADTGELSPATAAPVEQPAGALPDGKGQGMTARFVAYAQIMAGRAPLSAVRLDAAAAGACVRE